MFRKFALTGLLAAALGTGAQAADVAAPPAIAAPAPWAFDFAFGGKLMSDYNFRGISQSARGPSVNVYGELRYGWLYGGAAFWTTKLPTRPVGEIDIYGGIRPVIGDLTLDFGLMYYLYTPERQFITTGAETPVALAGTWTPRNTDFLESTARPATTSRPSSTWAARSTTRPTGSAPAPTASMPRSTPSTSCRTISPSRAPSATTGWATRPSSQPATTSRSRTTCTGTPACPGPTMTRSPSTCATMAPT